MKRPMSRRAGILALWSAVLAATAAYVYAQDTSPAQPAPGTSQPSPTEPPTTQPATKPLADEETATKETAATETAAEETGGEETGGEETGGEETSTAESSVEQSSNEPSSTEQPSTAPSADRASAVSDLFRDLEAYRDVSMSLDAQSSARAWVALFDRTLTLASESALFKADDYNDTFISLSHAIAVLPRPDVWPLIAEALLDDSRPPAADAEHAAPQNETPQIASPQVDSPDPAAPTSPHSSSPDSASPDPASLDIDDLSARRKLLIRKVVGQLLAGKTGSDLTHAAELAATYDGTDFDWIGDYIRDDVIREVVDADVRLADLIADPDRDSDDLVEIGRLIPSVGPDRARTAIERAISRGVRLSPVGVDPDTFALAQEIALSMSANRTLLIPQWALCNEVSPQARTLFEAMREQFKKTPGRSRGNVLSRLLGQSSAGSNHTDDTEYDAALRYQVVNLLVAGETESAAALAAQIIADDGEETYLLPAETIDRLRLPDTAPAVFSLLDDVLARHPKVGEWAEYFKAAASAGKTDRAVELAGQTARARSAGPQQDVLLWQLVDAQLFHDRVDEAAEVLREIISINDSSYSRVLATSRLAEIGVAADRPDLIDEGHDRLASMLKNRRDNLRGHVVVLADRIVKLLARSGRYEQALSFVTAAIVEAQHSYTIADDPSYRESDLNLLRNQCTTLVSLYVRASKPDEAIELAQGLEDWLAQDAAQILLAKEDRDWPLGYILAEALLERSLPPDQRQPMTAAKRNRQSQHDDAPTSPDANEASPGEDRSAPGADAEAAQPSPEALARAQADRQQAIALLRAVILRRPNFDFAYRALIKTAGAEAMPILDEATDADPTNNRAWISKARVYLLEGQTDRARMALQAARRIDAGDLKSPEFIIAADARLERRLADAAADTEASRRASDRARAFDLAADAKQLFAVNLTTRGLALQRQAVELAPDEYHLRLTLAKELDRVGDPEAVEHFRAALRLLPAAYSQTELRCIHCDGLLVNPAIADEVDRFTAERVAQSPDDPTALYLRAYRLILQDRSEQAIPLLDRALSIDPDYTAAWVLYDDISDESPVSPAFIDKIIAQLLRLDPYERHRLHAVDRAHDLTALWHAVDTHARRRPAIPTTLFPFPGSKPAEDVATPPDELASFAPYESFQSRTDTPSMAVARNARFTTLNMTLYNRNAR